MEYNSSLMDELYGDNSILDELTGGLYKWILTWFIMIYLMCLSLLSFLNLFTNVIQKYYTLDCLLYSDFMWLLKQTINGNKNALFACALISRFKYFGAQGYYLTVFSLSFITWQWYCFICLYIISGGKCYACSI